MSSFLMLYFLLLVIGHRLSEAQAGAAYERYLNYINEIRSILNTSCSPPHELSPEMKYILLNENFLRPNLEVFLKASQNFSEKGSQIINNLKEFRSILPPLTSTEEEFTIGNYSDFRSKLDIYLISLYKFLKKTFPTMHSGPSLGVLTTRPETS